jgi:hypothetical protein
MSYEEEDTCARLCVLMSLFCVVVSLVYVCVWGGVSLICGSFVSGFVLTLGLCGRCSLEIYVCVRHAQVSKETQYVAKEP